MKSKLNKILLFISLIYTIIILLLAFLGNINRIGYLSDFDLQASNNGEYVYNFKIKYYSKIFGHSDIYGVYVDTNKAIEDNNFIKEINMNADGSPFGNLISYKIIDFNKIDNVHYTLKIKFIYFIVFVALILLYIYLYMKYKNNVNRILEDNKSKIITIYVTVSAFLIFIIVGIGLLGKINHKANLEDLQLITESNLGYVYKAKVLINEKGIFSPNLIFQFPNKFSIDKKPAYIKSGYNIKITRQPDWYHKEIGALVWTNEDGSFTVSNSYSWNGYAYDIITSKGEIYKISLDAKRISHYNKASGSIIYNLDETNNNIFIPETDNISCEYKTYSSQINIKNSKRNKFPHFDLYFPKGVFNIKNIKIEQISDNLYLKPNNNIVFTSSIKIDNVDSININYKLNIRNYLFIILVILIISLILVCFNFLLYKVKNKLEKKQLIKNKLIRISLIVYNFYISYDKFINRYFFIISFIITMLLIVFHFWLLQPGYFYYYDDQNIFASAAGHIFHNWFPVIIQVFQSTLNKLFGYNTFYIFLVNIICWYVGLYFFVISVYKKLKSKKALLLFFLSFLGNIFFMNTTQNKDATAVMYLWLVYSIVFFIISFGIKNIKMLIPISIILSILLIFSLLWRHNMIVTIYPIFILFTYMILKNKFSNMKLYAVYFISIMLIFAFLLIFIFKINPYIWIKYYAKGAMGWSKNASRHLFMFQIAGTAAISNDDTLIPNDWYLEGKDFEYMKKLYMDNRVNGDLYKDVNTMPFKLYEINNLKEIWIKYILKHPLSYMKHIINYMSVIFCVKLQILSPDNIEAKSDMFGFSGYYDQIGIDFTPFRKKIYSILYNLLLVDINILLFIIIGVVMFFISGFMWIFKSNYRCNLLLFTFCASFASFATSMIVGFFTPFPLYRYIYPVIPISIISLISFITFIYDRGGFKKFIQELRGGNK